MNTVPALMCDHEDQGGIGGVDGLPGDDGWFSCDELAVAAMVFTDDAETPLQIVFSCADHAPEDLHEMMQGPPEVLWTMSISDVRQVI